MLHFLTSLPWRRGLLVFLRSMKPCQLILKLEAGLKMRATYLTRRAKTPRRCTIFAHLSPVCRTTLPCNQGAGASLELQVYMSNGIGNRTPHIRPNHIWTGFPNEHQSWFHRVPHDSWLFTLCFLQSSGAKKQQGCDMESIANYK